MSTEVLSASTNATLLAAKIISTACAGNNEHGRLPLAKSENASHVLVFGASKGMLSQWKQKIAQRVSAGAHKIYVEFRQIVNISSYILQ